RPRGRRGARRARAAARGARPALPGGRRAVRAVLAAPARHRRHFPGRTPTPGLRAEGPSQTGPDSPVLPACPGALTGPNGPGRKPSSGRAHFLWGDTSQFTQSSGTGKVIRTQRTQEKAMLFHATATSATSPGPAITSTSSRSGGHAPASIPARSVRRALSWAAAALAGAITAVAVMITLTSGSAGAATAPRNWIGTGWNVHLAYQADQSTVKHFFNAATS